MIRVVLALAMATAILGLALPAIEDAGVTHSDSQVAAELDRIDRAARTLAARSVGAPYGVTGRRTMTLSLPASTWARRGLAELSIPGLDGPQRLTWRVEVPGTYAGFVVSVPRGTPDTVGEFRYVRTGIG